jgi:hypothetical protein
MDVSEIAGAGKSHLLKQVEKATIAVGKTVTILSPTDASAVERSGSSNHLPTVSGKCSFPRPRRSA